MSAPIAPSCVAPGGAEFSAETEPSPSNSGPTVGRSSELVATRFGFRQEVLEWRDRALCRGRLAAARCLRMPAGAPPWPARRQIHGESEHRHLLPVNGEMGKRVQPAESTFRDLHTRFVVRREQQGLEVGSPRVSESVRQRFPAGRLGRGCLFPHLRSFRRCLVVDPDEGYHSGSSSSAAGGL